MKKSTVRKHAGRLICPLTHIDSKSVTSSKKGKDRSVAATQGNSMTRRGVKRVVRNKSSSHLSKPKNVAHKVLKTVSSKKRLIKVEAISEDGDSQANKENDDPTPAQKTKKRGRKKGSFTKPKLEVVKVQQTIIDEPMATPDTKLAKQAKRKVVEESGGCDKNSKRAHQSSTKKKSEKYNSSSKRVSLRKKTESVSEPSACKQEVPETPQQEPESEAKSGKFDHPTSGYGLRKRGRKPKKSRIYKDEDNIIFSHEKEEDMNKIDDSEFKLPNEERSKSNSPIHQNLNLEASPVGGDSYKDTVSRHNIIDHDMSDDQMLGKY